MDRPVQGQRLYKDDGEHYRWVTTPALAKKIWGKEWEKLPRKYVDDADIDFNLGEDITEWPETLEPPPNPTFEIRPIFGIGSCLPNAPVGHYKTLGCDYVIGNHGWWPHHDACKAEGVKPIVCINVYRTGTNHARPFEVSDVPYIENMVRDELAYFGPEGVGGWWSSGSRGEEPDAVAWGDEAYARKINESRKLFYKTVRRIDSDSQARPVVEQFDLTHKGMVGGAWRAGWEMMWLDKEACDVVVFDMYARNCSKQEVWDAVHKYWDAFPGAFCSDAIQVIPQLACYDYRPGIFHDLVWAYKDVLGSKMGLFFYSDEIIRPQEDVQSEIKEVVRECMSSF